MFPRVFPLTVFECDLVPVLHQIECGAVDGYRLKPSRFGLFLHATAGGEGLALDDAELGLTSVIVGLTDKFDLQGRTPNTPLTLRRCPMSLGNRISSITSSSERTAFFRLLPSAPRVFR